LKGSTRVIVLKFAILVLLSQYFNGIAQAVTPAVPPNVIWPQAVISVEVGEKFVIPLTISAGSQEVIFGGVWTRTDKAGISFEETAAGLILSANSSTRVNIVGNAAIAGLYRIHIDVALDNIIQTSEIVVQVEDPDEKARRARLSITGSSFEPALVDIDEPFKLKVEITNRGNDIAEKPIVTFDGGRNFRVLALTNNVELPSIKAGDKAEAVFRIEALENRESNVISINLSYGAFTRSETLNLLLPDVNEKIDKLPPRIRVSSFELLPAAEGRLALSISIQNTGEVDAKDINVTLDGTERLFAAKMGKATRISILQAGSKSEIEYLLAFSGKLLNHPINLTFEFKDSDGQLHKSSDTIYISHDSEPQLKISGFDVFAGDPEGEFELSLNIQNIGYSQAQSIEVSFTGNQAFPLNKSNLFLLDDISAKDSKRLAVDMKASAVADAYQIAVEIVYRSPGGAEHKTNEIITLSADSIGIEKEAYEGLEDVFLERYTLSTQQIYAGESFTITLYIKNNSADEIGQTRILLGGGTTQGATVFLQPDGQYSYHSEGIEPYGYLTKEITLLADHNASTMVHFLPITIKYEDENGRLMKTDAQLSIPVQQRGQINIFSVEVPETATVGEPIQLSMEFANVGRTALSSVLVTIEGDFEKEDYTYFIPQFAVGITDFFQGTIIPDEAGMLTGSFVITYFDARNNEVRIEKPFTAEIGAAIAANGTEIEGETTAASFLRDDVSLPVAIAGTLVILLLIIAATVLILKKGKLRRGKNNNTQDGNQEKTL